MNESPEIEQLSSPFFAGDLTANWHPMMLDDASLSPSDPEDADLTLEDMDAGLEVENRYSIYGPTAFKPYDEYKLDREKLK